MGNMSQDVRDVFQKWIDGNEIFEAIIHKCGSFYDMVKVQLVYEKDNEIDHAYNLDADVSFHDFSKRLLDKNFYIESYMKSFRPVSVCFRCADTHVTISHVVWLLKSKNKSFMPE